MNRQERRDARLARAQGYREAARAHLANVEHTQHRLKNRANVAAKLRALGYTGRVIRGHGWWELWQGGRAPVGSAEHADGILHVYAPAQPVSNSAPPRKADPQYRRVTISRPLQTWDGMLAALGTQRRQGEGVNEALHRAMKAKRFRAVVK